MRTRQRNFESPAKSYFEKGQTFSKTDADLLKLRIGGRFTRRAEDKKKSPTEIVALQLEFEDRQLSEWRDRLTKVRDREQSEQNNTTALR